MCCPYSEHHADSSCWYLLNFWSELLYSCLSHRLVYVVALGYIKLFYDSIFILIRRTPVNPLVITRSMHSQRSWCALLHRELCDANMFTLDIYDMFKTHDNTWVTYNSYVFISKVSNLVPPKYEFLYIYSSFVFVYLK